MKISYLHGKMPPFFPEFHAAQPRGSKTSDQELRLCSLLQGSMRRCLPPMRTANGILWILFFPFTARMQPKFSRSDWTRTVRCPYCVGSKADLANQSSALGTRTLEFGSARHRDMSTAITNIPTCCPIAAIHQFEFCPLARPLGVGNTQSISTLGKAKIRIVNSKR
jgi:hypothetical protein